LRGHDARHLTGDRAGRGELLDGSRRVGGSNHLRPHERALPPAARSPMPAPGLTAEGSTLSAGRVSTSPRATDTW
jgi:hypothetical protein